MFRYQLDRSSRKYVCPRCDQKRFVRMVDAETGDLCEERFGRCDREQSCGYFLHPNQDRPLQFGTPEPAHTKATQRTDTHFDIVQESIFQQSIAHLSRTTLFLWLSTKFGTQTATNVCTAYGVGANPFNPAQTAFWQIDAQCNKRTAELIVYCSNGKRDRRIDPNWIHAELKKRSLIKSFNLRQCAYGVHLLAKDAHKKVCVVEGAKTAIVLSAHFPEYLWLGTPGAHGLNQDLMQLLDRERTLLVPDAGFENVWHKKVGGRFQIMNTNDLISNGADLADLI